MPFVFGLWLLLAALLGATPCSAASSSLQEGLRAYRALSFPKAITLLEQSLGDPALTKAQRLEALRHLALCYYNQGRLREAVQTWKKALRLDPQVQLPAGQAPPVLQFFEKLRSSQRPSARRSSPAKARTRPKNSSARRRPPSRGRLSSPERRIARRPPQRPPLRRPRPPSFAARHIVSLSCLGAGLLAAGAAGIFGAMALQQNDEMLQARSREAALQAFQRLPGSTTAATSLWIAAGALGTASLVAFLVELSLTPRTSRKSR